MNTKIIRKHFFFKGRVQGVGFRYRAQNAASLYSVTGWVKNLYDGSVEMEAQGASVVTFPQSMRFQPVAAHAGVGDQPDLELRGGLHALGDDRRDTLLLRAEHVDHQFVVHLQDCLLYTSDAADD